MLSSNLVTENDVHHSSAAFKENLNELKKRGYLIRPMSHTIFHLQVHCKRFKCGVEFLRAYIYKHFIISLMESHWCVAKSPEQWRNRLVERSKYLFRTTYDLTI